MFLLHLTSYPLLFFIWHLQLLNLFHEHFNFDLFYLIKSPSKILDNDENAVPLLINLVLAKFRNDNSIYNLANPVLALFANIYNIIVYLSNILILFHINYSLLFFLHYLYFHFIIIIIIITIIIH